jgi:FkbM family methyltransferase
LVNLNYLELLNKYKTTHEFQRNLSEKFDISELTNVYIFGTSAIAQILHDEFNKLGIEVIGFIDNFKKEENSYILNKKIFNPNDLIHEKDNISVIIASTAHCKAIINQLEKLNFKTIIPYYVIWANILSFEDNQTHRYELSLTEKFHLKLLKFEDLIVNKDKYLSLYKYFDDNKSLKTLDNLMKYRITLDGSYLLEIYDSINLQYFDSEIIKFGENEIFVDGGCYHGENSIQFIQNTNSTYKKILLFDPDLKNLQQAKYYLKDYKNIEFYSKGLFNEKTTIKFSHGKEGASKISEEEDDDENVTLIDLIDLNSFDDKITFIKMDIEGAEKQAIIGAEKHLRNNVKLAICIYHKIEDIYEIPKLIKEINPNYKFYLRHYSPSFVETVLYAVPY